MDGWMDGRMDDDLLHGLSDSKSMSADIALSMNRALSLRRS